MAFLKEFFEKIDFEKSTDDKKHEQLASMQWVNHNKCFIGVWTIEVLL